MTRVYLADATISERSALRLLVRDLGMEMVGEASTWGAALDTAPTSLADMLIVDWDLIPVNTAGSALDELRKACPAAVVIVLISHMEAREQAALSAGADAFISKNELSQRVAERLRSAAAAISARVITSDPGTV